MSMFAMASEFECSLILKMNGLCLDLGFQVALVVKKPPANACPVEAVVTLRSGQDMCLQGRAGAPTTPRLTVKEAEVSS